MSFRARLIDWTQECHETLIGKFGPKLELPSIDFFVSAGKRLGFYRRGTGGIHYNTVYASLVDDDVSRNTAFHEVCHAWQDALAGDFVVADHGELWRWLMAEVGYRDARANCTVPGWSSAAFRAKVRTVAKAQKLMAQVAAGGEEAVRQMQASLRELRGS